MEDSRHLYPTKKITHKIPSHWKYVLIGTILLFCCITVFIYLLQTWHPVDPDTQQASQKIILQMAGLMVNKEPNDLTKEDFTKIIELNFAQKEIYDLTQLKNFPNIQELNLHNIIVPEIKVPAWMNLMAKLKVYDISKWTSSKNNLIYLGPLKKLNSLHKIVLSQSPVKNIKPLKKMKNIRYLDLRNTQVNNIKPLAGLINLRELRLSHTQIENLSPLKKLAGLQHLSISDTNVNNIEPLQNMTNLQELWLNDTDISDIEPIKKLPNLRYLFIKNCKNITDKQVEDLQKALHELEIKR